jgi:hypothetical protein
MDGLQRRRGGLDFIGSVRGAKRSVDGEKRRAEDVVLGRRQRNLCDQSVWPAQIDAIPASFWVGAVHLLLPSMGSAAPCYWFILSNLAIASIIAVSYPLAAL